MPPKKPPPKKESKKAAAKVLSQTIASIPVEDRVDGKQLWMATDALQKSKALRNYFQLERDKINAYWEISRRELEATKAELRQKEREKTEMYERHQIEAKVYKQKIRHVLYEHQVQMTQLKLEAEQTLRNKQIEHNEQERFLKQDNRDLTLLSREQELLIGDKRRTQILLHDREISEQMEDYERQSKEIYLKYEAKIRELREDMNRQRNNEIEAIQKRKEDHVNELREAHDKSYQEIKEYFNEITTSNLETIRTLKEEVYTGKRTEARNEKAMFEIAQMNKRLTEPLTKAQKQKKQLEMELANYERDRAALRVSKQELNVLEGKMKVLLWEHEVLKQRYEKLKEDRDIIFNKYNDMLQTVQQKAIFKRVLLNRKIEVVHGELEKKEIQISETLRKANVEPSIINDVDSHINNIIMEKDNTINTLQQLLLSVGRRHEKVIAAYGSYAKANGVALLQPS